MLHEILNQIENEETNLEFPGKKKGENTKTEQQNSSQIDWRNSNPPEMFSHFFKYIRTAKKNSGTSTGSKIVLYKKIPVLLT